MATTTSNILRVALTNAYSDNRNINLKNPKSNVTLAQITTAFSPLMSDTFLAGSEYLTTVKGAKNIVTQTTDIS